MTYLAALGGIIVDVIVGIKAQCGRYHKDGQLCTQHIKMAARWSCEYCGGNDELPPDHCMDCTRPADAALSQSAKEKS